MIKKTWKCLLKSVVLLVCQGPFTDLVLNSANIVTFVFEIAIIFGAEW